MRLALTIWSERIETMKPPELIELERLSEHDPVLARLLRNARPTADDYIWMQWEREGGPPKDIHDEEQRIINLLTALERR
jgi:hypothetical protein